ncbi:MAG: Rieske (2Fe-2S) protein [Candidatus Hodarchaeales archaeon]|jgi:nitrite reductase/ring-hydroxylating ferredoxin subunit
MQIIQSENVPWIKVAKSELLVEKELKAYSINNEDILLVRYKGEVSAFQNTCTHANVPLSIGWINEDGHITCAMHHAIFHQVTGKHLSGPGGNDLKKFQIREKSEWIEIYWDTESDNEILVKPITEANRDVFLEKVRNLSKEFNLEDDS